MKRDWTSVVLGTIAASCGLYVFVRHGFDLPQVLEGPVYGMIIIGTIAALMGLRRTKRKGVIMPKPENAILPIPCPSCSSKKGLRLVPEDQSLRVICVDCKEVDEDLDPNAIFDTLMAIMQYSSDNDGLDHETLSNIVYEKFGVPEFEEEEDDASE